MTKAREAEMHYIKEQDELEIKKASDMAEIESNKFEQMVKSIGAETIQSIATAGPDMQVCGFLLGFWIYVDMLGLDVPAMKCHLVTTLLL